MALLRKITCHVRHPMNLHHPVLWVFLFGFLLGYVVARCSVRSVLNSQSFAYCSVLQCAAVGVLQWVCCSGCAAVSVLQWVCCSGCAAVSVLQWVCCSECAAVTRERAFQQFAKHSKNLRKQRRKCEKLSNVQQKLLGGAGFWPLYPSFVWFTPLIRTNGVFWMSTRTLPRS